jgi:hypothetical protein
MLTYKFLTATLYTIHAIIPHSGITSSFTLAAMRPLDDTPDLPCLVRSDSSMDDGNNVAGLSGIKGYVVQIPLWSIVTRLVALGRCVHKSSDSSMVDSN